MYPSLLWAVASFAVTTVEAKLPGAVDPIPSPMRNLTWGQLNFLHSTDTHGWLSGHLLEPQYSSDWGDYVSFAEHMRRIADERGVDLLLVDTGDRVEGAGLYDSSHPKGRFTYDIFRQQTVDLLSTGNHELYVAQTAERELLKNAPSFGDKYIASNVDIRHPKTGEWTPLAPQRYRVFDTKHHGFRIAAFGFLFDFQQHAENVRVHAVEETVQESWFQEVIQRDDIDVFLVYGHVGLRMPEYRLVFDAIRAVHPDKPIIFLGGHAHERDAVKYDDNAYALASGRYLETVGWASIDNLRVENATSSQEDQTKSTTNISFSRSYIDNNLLGYYHHTGLDEQRFPTKRGQETTQQIQTARDILQLDQVIGCAPQNYWMTRAPFSRQDSIYHLLSTEILPSQVVLEKRQHLPHVILVNTGALRFDIFKGPFTVDAIYTTSPFVSNFVYLPDVEYGTVKKLLAILNGLDKLQTEANVLREEGLDVRLLTVPQQRYASPHVQLLTEDHDAQKATDEEEPKRLELRSSGLTLGHTTIDDLGDDGDDTIHERIPEYLIPNCLESRIHFPEGLSAEELSHLPVDLVFDDYLLSFILPALQLLGDKVSSSDVGVYTAETLTYHINQFIKKNWARHCE